MYLVSVEEAREILRQEAAIRERKMREKEDVELSRQLANVISKDCQGCYELFDVGDMFTFDCAEGHRFCLGVLEDLSLQL